MIELFRSVRQKVLAENRLGRYALYAIGEIVLVVIGILIALQVNNWNEHRKQHLRDVALLENIRNEIVLDTTQIASRIGYYERIDRDIERSVALLDTATDLDREATRFLGEVISQLEVVLPVYKNVERSGSDLSGGDLSRLDADLNKHYLAYLDSYKFNYDLANKFSGSLINTVNEHVYPHVRLNFSDPSRSKVAFELGTLRNDPSILNAFQISLWYRKTVISTLRPQLTTARSLLQRIDRVLESE